MKRILISLLFCFAVAACTGMPETQEPREVVMIINGNVQQVTVIPEHPCEGNWNFCDNVMDNLD